MSVRQRATSPSVLVWLAVFGAPFAWTAQHLVGFSLTIARCSVVGHDGGVPQTGVTIAVTAAAAAVAVLAELLAIRVFRATKGAHEPPEARIRFLAIVGMAVAPLFLLIILMSGFGAVLLPDCHQS